MNPSHTVEGRNALIALGILPARGRRASSSERVDPGPGDCHPLEMYFDLNEHDAAPNDPDVALCKLSLTCDESRHPRVHKGPFDRDFEAFM
jgi:hypothetical protein